MKVDAAASEVKGLLVGVAILSGAYKEFYKRVDVKSNLLTVMLGEEFDVRAQTFKAESASAQAITDPQYGEDAASEPRIMFRNGTNESSAEYVIGGQLGHLCPRSVSNNGAVFSLVMELPASDQIAVPIQVRLIIGENAPSVSTNAELHTLIVPILTSFFSTAPHTLADTEAVFGSCGAYNGRLRWRGDTVVYDGSAEDMLQAIGQLRARLSQLVGGGDWPSASELAANATYELAVTPARAIQSWEVDAPYLRVTLRHADQVVGTIGLLRLWYGGGYGNDPQMHSSLLEITSATKELLMGCRDWDWDLPFPRSSAPLTKIGGNWVYDPSQ
jgi:hypothetical protein